MVERFLSVCFRKLHMCGLCAESVRYVSRASEVCLWGQGGF